MIIAVYMRSKKVKWLLLSRGLQLFDLGRKVRHFFRLLHYELLVNLNGSGDFALTDENDGEAFLGRLAGPGGVNLLTSVDGPLLLPVVDKVLYAYNSNGSLTSVTNEVGLVTQITALTSNGLPASITDPNGVITNLAYDARDRLTTITVNPVALSNPAKSPMST